MYEELDRSPKQNRSSRSPRQPQRQRAEPAQANERIRGIKPPAFQSDLNLGNIPMDSPQPRASAPLDPQTIIVPQVLSRGLDVAGEYHNISNKKRPEEKRFCFQQTGSDEYYVEGKFKEAIVDNFGNVTDGPDSSDPWDLNMFQVIGVCKLAIQSIRNILPNEAISDPSVAEQLNSPLNYLTNYTGTLAQHTQDLVRGEDGGKWRKLNGEEAVRELMPKISFIYDLGEELARITPDKLPTLPPEDIMNIVENIENAFIPVEEIIARNNKDIASLGTFDLCKRRTDGMKKAFDLKYDRNQVVKVGGFHYKDLEPLKNTLKFNIVSAEDFYSAFEQWEQREKLKLAYEQWEQQSKSDNEGKKRRIESPEQGESSKATKGEGYNSMKAPELRELVKNRRLNAVLKGKYNKPVSKAKKEELMAVLTESDNRGKRKMSPSVTTG